MRLIDAEKLYKYLSSKYDEIEDFFYIDKIREVINKWQKNT